MLLAAGTAVAQQVGGAQGAQTLSVLDTNATYNREMIWVMVWAVVLAAIIFVAVSAALFYTVFKYRAKPGDTSEGAQFHGNNRLEIILVAIPVVIVTLLSVLSVRTLVRVHPDPEGLPRISTLAAQFWWNFSYPGAEAAAGGVVTNGNEMVVPASNPATGTRASFAVDITSRDVVHAFWAPNLGQQRQAFPGTQLEFVLETDRPGMYQGNCNMLCGASHANMRYKVAALPLEDYNTFLRVAQEWVAPEPQTPQLQRGYEIFMTGGGAGPSCASCHRIQGTPAQGVAGPDMSFFGSRRTLGAGMWEGERAAEMLGPWIVNSEAVKPGSLMPPYPNLSGEDLSALTAYLDTLRLPAEADYWQILFPGTTFSWTEGQSR